MRFFRWQLGVCGAVLAGAIVPGVVECPVAQADQVRLVRAEVVPQAETEKVQLIQAEVVPQADTEKVRLVRAEVVSAERPILGSTRSVMVSRGESKSRVPLAFAGPAAGPEIAAGPVTKNAESEETATEPKGPAILFADQRDAPKRPLVAALEPTIQPIGELVPDIRPPAGPLPPSNAEEMLEEAQEKLGGQPVDRVWADGGFLWASSGLCHNPLYFEDINLERGGHSYGVFQPVVSAVRFYATVPLLPVKMLMDPPCECTYTLGHYRPGSCSPRHGYSLVRP